MGNAMRGHHTIYAHTDIGQHIYHIRIKHSTNVINSNGDFCCCAIVHFFAHDFLCVSYTHIVH